MRKVAILFGTVSLLVLPALGGCFKLARDTTVLRQYVLGGTAPRAVATTPAPGGLTIGVRRLDLAPYLAVPAVLLRRGANRIVISEFHRWGEDPVQGINRAVAGYLAQERGIATVDVAPWPIRSPHDFVVQLHVSRFEGTASEDTLATAGEAHLLAAWEIFRQPDGELVARGAAEYREGGWTVGDYAGLVVLLDRGLITVARQLAACLRDGAARAADPAAAEPLFACDRTTDPHAGA